MAGRELQLLVLLFLIAPPPKRHIVIYSNTPRPPYPPTPAPPSRKAHTQLNWPRLPIHGGTPKSHPTRNEQTRPSNHNPKEPTS